MTDFIRLSVAGRARRVELAVPTDEVVADLVPRLRDLLQEPVPASDPLVLVRRSGPALDAADTVAGQQLEHGCELVLVAPGEVPPPPEVADVTDVLADTLAARRERQVVSINTLGYAAAVGVLAAGAGRQLTPQLGSGPVPPAAALLLGLVVAAVLVRRHGRIRLGLVAAALGLAAPLVFAVVAAEGTRVAAAVGVAALLAVALLPRLALAASGLTRIDDDVVGGRPRPREMVLGRADAAYALLTWTTLAAVLPLTAAVATLVAGHGPWSLGLGGAVLLGTALRARALPLPTQQVPFGLAAVTGVVAAVYHHSPDPGMGAGALVAVAAVLVACSAGISARRAARLRRVASRVEALVLVTVLPLALGTFGVYPDLVEAWR